MSKRTFFGILVLFFVISVPVTAQDDNPNLISRSSKVSFEASSTFPSPASMAPPLNIADERLQLRWETDMEKSGAWIMVKWKEPQKIRELWLVNKATPYDVVLDPYMRTANYLVPRNLNIVFSDGSSFDVELRLSEYYQIMTLPREIEANWVKFTIEKLWDKSGELNTGMCKIKAYAKPNPAGFRIDIYEMYDIQNDKPVQSAKIQIVNPGNDIKEAKLLITNNGKDFGTIQMNDIPARSVTTRQIWIPAVFERSDLKFKISTHGELFASEQTCDVRPYNKNYFDGGIFNILNTNHNDLGWLNTQSITADYRSSELIVPAMDLMKKDPDFKYTMESVEYLKEFLERNPGRKEEMTRLMHEKRFAFGASYIQNLQVQLGQEKLIRQFYYGRRWLLENFPGCDTRFYMNTDVPGLTYQLPQILKKSGIDYIVQGRMAWGFYYWQGLDGTSIPMFAFRYASPYGLMNPVNNTGWLKFLDEREYFYKPRELPKSMLYDFNSDYLPPCPDIIPFAKDQNIAMKKFASVWNENFKNDSAKKIDPPVIRFVEPDGVLKEIFGKGELNIETIKGDWPMTWAYYDEPGNREGLLAGRKGIKELAKAEGLYSWLTTLDKSIVYPKDELDHGWLANCWPDHGWGGNRGTVTDSFYVASYKKSLQIGKSLTDSAGVQLLNLVPRGDINQIPLVIYNTVGWERTDIVSCVIHYPENWKGLSVKDLKGNSIPVEVISHYPEYKTITIAFLVKDIPSFGFSIYYAAAAKSFPDGNIQIKPDSVENDFVRVKFGSGGITSLYDKINKKEVLRTDKFFGGEVIQMTAPDLAWESYAIVNMKDFDKTSFHEFKTIRSVESPIRYIIEKVAKMKYFTLRERFILNKHSRELVVEADILDWTGEKEKELRILFPLNLDRSFRASYEVPFGTVEMGRDEIDYSCLPDNYESQFNDRYARKDLPFREAINWVNVSSGDYKGSGSLFASDMNVHLFRDETADPVDYPVVQHVLLSSRKSLAWNPEYWFTQAGNHSYRMAIYPHNGNWRFAFKEGLAFNSPLAAYSGKGKARVNDPSFPVAKSLISASPSNIIISALKQAEDGNGLFIRFYEAEGRYTKAVLKGYLPFSKVILTDMLEYNEKELQVAADGSIIISVRPWEIVNIKIVK
jgi:alpha-mannosidase